MAVRKSGRPDSFLARTFNKLGKLGSARAAGERRRRLGGRVKLLTRRQKKQVFKKWVNLMGEQAKAERNQLVSDLDARRVLRDWISGALSPKQADNYIRLLNLGKILNYRTPEIGIDFTVVPDRFLTLGQRRSLQRVLREDLPDKRVITLSQFRKWAMKNINFEVVKRDLEL